MRISGNREEAGCGAGEKVSQGREPPGGNKHEETGRCPKGYLYRQPSNNIGFELGPLHIFFNGEYCLVCS